MTALAVMTPIAPPRPKGEVVSHCCKLCPFRHGGGALKGQPEELERFTASVETGAAFYCHETVILDPRTTFTGRGADREPSPRLQPHFKLCRGAREVHLNAWRLRVIASGQVPGEEP